MKKIALAALMIYAPLHAEIEKVTLRWQSGVCTSSCVKDLTKHLSQVPGVAEAQVSATQADLKWKPGQPFSFYALDAGMRYVGVRQDRIFVTVKGTLSHDDKNIYLTSDGDGTRFTLVNPISITPGQAAARDNIESHQLSEGKRSELIKIEEEDKVVTVKGPLFEPYRSPPLNLIIENLSAKKRENKR